MRMLCLQNGLSEFYQNVLVEWSEFKYRGLVEVTEIEEEVLWKNSHIKFNVIKNGSWKDSILLNSKVGIHQLLFEFEYAKLKTCFACYWLTKMIRSKDSRFKIQDNLLSCKKYIQFAFGHLKVLYMYIQI